MTDDEKPNCRFGKKCFRKNPNHMKLYAHPWRDEPVVAAVAQKRTRKIEKPDKEAVTSPHSKKERNASPVSADKQQSDHDPPQAKSVESPNSDDLICEENSKDVSKPVSIPKFESFADRRAFIENNFLFKAPDDFYTFWRLAQRMKGDNPCDAFVKAGLKLGGPFDLLAGNFDGRNDLTLEQLLIHHRGYYDLPEFQTVVVSSNVSDTFHIGYWKDPVPDPQFILCSNDAAKQRGFEGKLIVLGENIFAAVYHTIMEKSKKIEDDDGQCAILEKLARKVKSEAESHGYPILISTPKLKKRRKNSCAPGFHEIGIVVTMTGDLGYRPVPETNSDLKKMFKKIESGAKENEKVFEKRLEPLQELMTWTQFANDECDYGMGYELGIAVFLSGVKCLHSQVNSLLSVAYLLMGCPDRSKVLDAHLANRRSLVPSSL